MDTKRSGQTLIEVMIALFALVTGFMGILGLLAQSIYITKTLDTQTTATYLASEGVELAKNILDHDVYQAAAGFGTGWAKGGADTAFTIGDSYQIDYTTCNNLSDIAAPCVLTQGSNPPALLFLDPSTGLYSYNQTPGSILTPFQRKINITSTGPNELTVEVSVRWQVPNSLVQQKIQLQDDFYNWRP